MRVDDQTILDIKNDLRRLTDWQDGLVSAEKLMTENRNLSDQNKQLQKENQELKAKLASIDYQAREERAKELNEQESRIKAIEKLAYDKGYATAYTEVTTKMRAS